MADFEGDGEGGKKGKHHAKGAIESGFGGDFFMDSDEEAVNGDAKDAHQNELRGIHGVNPLLLICLEVDIPDGIPVIFGGLSNGSTENGGFERGIGNEFILDLIAFEADKIVEALSF